MDFQKVTAVATRRGIFQPAYDAYGGLAGFYDYGPVGVRMRRRILEVWRKHYVIGAGCLELDGALIGSEALFQASGHLGEFDDALVDCPDCGHWQVQIEDRHRKRCEKCGVEFELPHNLTHAVLPGYGQKESQ